MKSKLMAGAILGLCFMFCLMALWRQTRQLSVARAMNNAHQATITALSQERKATVTALDHLDKSKSALVRKLAQERQTIAQAVHNDATTAHWHDDPLPASVYRVLTPGADSDTTPAASYPPYGSYPGAGI